MEDTRNYGVKMMSRDMSIYRCSGNVSRLFVVILYIH